MKRQSPKGFGTAFAKAKGAKKDTFEFEGKTYRTQGGYNYAKPIGEAKTKKPKKSTSEKPTSSSAPEKSKRPASRPSKPEAKSSTGGPARYRQPSPPKKVNAGASNPPTQENTQSVGKSSTGGRARYKGFPSTYKAAERATDLSLETRIGKLSKGEDTVRNAAAYREKLRRKVEETRKGKRSDNKKSRTGKK